MPLPLLAAGLSLLPSLFKGISGIGQGNKANMINPVNPGYTTNSGVINNARVLADRSANYQMPGYGNAVNNINASTATGFNSGVQGASSGGDVLDLATKLAYGQGQRLNELAVQNAQGQDQALLQSLNADAAAGQEAVNKNAYDRQIYQDQLRQKAALTEAGNENIYGALDSAAGIGSSLLNPMPLNADGSNGVGLTQAQLNSYNKFRARRGISS